jgi:hypothetical protein
MTGQFEWENIPSWGRFDLGQMKTFKFEPRVQSIGENLDTLGGEDAIAQRATEAVAAVLKTCAGSLLYFNYRNSCPIQWPGDEVIPLPRLKRFCLGSGSIHPSI